MLGWALTFLIIALVAAVLGFGGIAGLSMEIAKIIFFVAILLFAIAAVVGFVRGRSPTLPGRQATRKNAPSEPGGFFLKLLIEISPAASRPYGSGRLVGAEIIRPLDPQQLRQRR